jgi:hypothetical protein
MLKRGGLRVEMELQWSAKFLTATLHILKFKTLSIGYFESESSVGYEREMVLR